MAGFKMSPFGQKTIEIFEKIKAYTFLSPSNQGTVDPSYKSYLSRCSQLFQLDKQLSVLPYVYDFDDPEQFELIEEELLRIEQEVDRLTND